MFKFSLTQKTGFILGIFSVAIKQLTKINSKAAQQQLCNSKAIESLLKKEVELKSLQEQNAVVIANLKNLLGK